MICFFPCSSVAMLVLPSMVNLSLLLVLPSVKFRVNPWLMLLLY